MVGPYYVSRVLVVHRTNAPVPGNALPLGTMHTHKQRNITTTVTTTIINNNTVHSKHTLTLMANQRHVLARETDHRFGWRINTRVSMMTTLIDRSIVASIMLTEHRGHTAAATDTSTPTWRMLPIIVNQRWAQQAVRAIVHAHVPCSMRCLLGWLESRD